MIIYKSLYKLLNKSLRIIRPITKNNKNSQKWSLCYDVDFSKKCGRPGKGGLKIRVYADKVGFLKMGKSLRTSFITIARHCNCITHKRYILDSVLYSFNTRYQQGFCTVFSPTLASAGGPPWENISVCIFILRVGLL